MNALLELAFQNRGVWKVELAKAEKAELRGNTTEAERRRANAAKAYQKMKLLRDLGTPVEVL